MTDRAPYQSHSETSRQAAEEIIGSVKSLRRQVYDCLVNAGADGLTDDEMQILTGINPSTQRPRRIELVNAKLVCDSGKRRQTLGKRQAVVWVTLLESI